jgi:ribonuclease BN (tRNA processing enzyme)
LEKTISWARTDEYAFIQTAENQIVQFDKHFRKMADRIKFLGTAGARIVVAKQLRSSAGTWITLDEKNLLLDPGPGTLVRCIKSRPSLDPTQLDAIILSHQHIDHANDVNIMIEAMTDGGFSKKGALFAPLSALKNDPIVLKYIRRCCWRTLSG